jgi:hypothetical protein
VSALKLLGGGLPPAAGAGGPDFAFSQTSIVAPTLSGQSEETIVQPRS